MNFSDELSPQGGGLLYKIHPKNRVDGKKVAYMWQVVVRKKLVDFLQVHLRNQLVCEPLGK